MIPFLDLTLPEPLYSDISDATQRVMESNCFILGPETERFEHALAEHEQVKYAVTVGSGLDALTFLLLAHNIGPGDEVIVPSHTFIATWLAVTHTGATIVPVDVDRITHLLTPTAVEAELTRHTAAVIPVHLYGRACDIWEFEALADKHGFMLLADAAQSLGAMHQGKRASSYGHGAATSFYPGKNLGAMGDGGAVLTDNPVIADYVRRLRNYGSLTKNQHPVDGWNSRLDELQCAILAEKLPYLDQWNAHRVDIAAIYDKHIHNFAHPTPWTSESSWHLYPIQTYDRDYRRSILAQRDVETGVHYPIPPHKQPIYALNNFHLPVAERIADRTLSLPIGPNLRLDQAEHIAEIVNMG